MVFTIHKLYVYNCVVVNRIIMNGKFYKIKKKFKKVIVNKTDNFTVDNGRRTSTFQVLS